MWIFTEYGFFSIVSAWNNETDKTPHSDLLMVRARRKQHLENLIDNFDELQDCKITESAKTDYPVRMFVDKKIFALVLVDLVNSVNYVNFKDCCHDSISDDQEYISYLYRVWYSGVQMGNSK